MHLVVVGGSDAGISAALRARELDPQAEVTVVVADAYPNYSICGIPYYISGDVPDWHDLAHRTREQLDAAGIHLLLETVATRIDAEGQRLQVRHADDGERWLPYDALVVGTGAVPVRPPIHGLDGLRTADGVHLLHTMGDTFALTDSLDERTVRSALIVGAGYVGVEMAEGLTARGVHVTQVEALPEVLPTVDPELGALIRAELVRNGVDVRTATTVTHVERGTGTGARLHVAATGSDGEMSWDVDLVLVVVGVQPDTGLLVGAGATTGPRGAVLVEPDMSTGLPQVWAAGDCVVTHHRILGTSYLPLGTTAHKQGRVAGENAVGGRARFAGSVGTQVVKVFDLVAARTGLREHEATAAGFHPVTTASTPDDHKRYYPGAAPISIRITGDATTGRLLGAQLVGTRTTQTAKRVDTFAAALFHEMDVAGMADLDLAYTPPLGSPWDAVQVAAQAWVAGHRLEAERASLGREAVERKPAVLFVCVHNAGRSQLAAGLAAAYAGDRLTVLSAGTEPDDAVSSTVLASLDELGIDRHDETPRLITAEIAAQADVIVALKPGLELPGHPHVEIWALPDPAGWTLDGIRGLRDHLDRRVRVLVDELLAP